MKAIFRYPGSKWKIAPWIVSHFPENYTNYVYLEPFGGSLAVFFNKEPGAIEVVNDLDGDIINLFRVLRERPEELKRAIELTPYSREEYDLAFEPCEDPVERARRFMIIANQGIGAKRSTKSGWQCYASPDPGGCVVKWSSVVNVIEPAAKRLRGSTTNLVHIEHRDALDLIRRFDDSNVLMYLDPPYMRRTRRSGALYRHEMENKQHADLLETIKKSKAKIVISGYDDDYYNEQLTGWDTDEVIARTTVGNATEKIWRNFQECDQIALEM